jgi:cytochrome c556
MNNISTDTAIELILYAVAEKTKMGLDMEQVVRAAKNDLIGFWEKDMKEIEHSCHSVYGGN